MLPAQEQFAQFSVDGQRLYGLLHIPNEHSPSESSGDRPAQGWPSVVLVHGFTGNQGGDHRLLPVLARHLAARGVACLHFDCRGSGISQGDFSEMTVTREVQDTEAAFDYMRHQPGLDPERVMLLGFSMGGIVVSLAASQVKPHRLALWAPALPELWLPMLRGGFVPPVVSDHGGWPVSREFLLEVTRLKPLEAANAWATNRGGGVARVFHGDADQTCPPEFGVRYAQALGCDAVAIPGGTHTFESFSSTEMLYTETVRFLTGG
ncbi:S9 family peptidase [Deinococcus sp. QL22]|uniref:alpha/beta hydrolase family protein n=1 Tax=Deinococcus sp. QL22 TaxID=2939437 RepID=UPI00201813FA|nr:alpha/beta fold hydrolase [Deinococcus sp. QL22]UQN06840.1 alpha/beta fold hydrolase [Deinococcus sp. QL22]